MFQKLLAIFKKTFSIMFGSKLRRGASILTILTFASYALGLVRDILFSHVFGADAVLDTYYAAFNIPDLMLNIFIAGTLLAAFTPIFTHLRASGEEKEAEKVATTMLVMMPLAIGIISVIAFIFMPWLTSIVAPGFVGAQKEMLIDMSRLLLIASVIFSISNMLGSMLISYERFIGYALAPILYNVGLISAIPFVRYFGSKALIFGAIFGALLHFAIRLIDIRKTSFKLALPPDTKNPHFRQILKLMIPRMAGQPVEQIMYLMFTSLATTLAVGSVTIMNFARNFQAVPVSIFGISLSVAIIAPLSRKVAEGDRAGFMRHFWETIRPLAFMTTLAGIVYFFLGELIFQIFFGHGKFTAEQIHQTGTLLAYFAFSIPTQSFIFILARSFYALKDTWTPLIVSIPGLFAIGFMAKWLIPTMGMNAIPFSYSVVLAVQVVVLFLMLMRKINRTFPTHSPHSTNP
ncbi:MAG: murein biosynthesis integral membrane protein MurJ [Patescibacteria group bacterium]